MRKPKVVIVMDYSLDNTLVPISLYLEGSEHEASIVDVFYVETNGEYGSTCDTIYARPLGELERDFDLPTSILNRIDY